MPTNSESLTKGLEAMSRFFVGDATLRDTLHRVAEVACDAVGRDDRVGITMLLEGRPRAAVFTDDTAPEIDVAQYDPGVGPCLDAFRLQQVFPHRRYGHGPAVAGVQRCRCRPRDPEQRVDALAGPPRRSGRVQQGRLLRRRRRDRPAVATQAAIVLPKRAGEIAEEMVARTTRRRGGQDTT